MKEKEESEEMLEKCDFSQGEKGRYFTRYREGSSVVVLDPDVAEIFRGQHLVNESLRALASIIKLREKEKV